VLIPRCAGRGDVSWSQERPLPAASVPCHHGTRACERASVSWKEEVVEVVDESLCVGE